MSTRATYRFIGRERKPTVTVYIHHDGYPDGAATYFYNMLINSSYGSLATQFIRANDRADITANHELHSDTDYRYDIEWSGTDTTVKWYKRNPSADCRDDGYVYQGHAPLAEFVNQHTAYIDGFEPFKLVKLRYGQNEWLNTTTAQQQLNCDYGPIHHLRIWNEHGSMTRTAGNWMSCVEEAKAVLAEFPELMTDEIRGLLSPEPAAIDG